MGFSNHSLENGAFMIVLTYIYAICLMGYGIFGFHKAGSLISLISGLVFGITLFSICIANNKRWSQVSAPSVTLILTLMFAIRAYVSQRPILLGWTIATFILFILFAYRMTKIAQDRKERG